MAKNKSVPKFDPAAKPPGHTPELGIDDEKPSSHHRIWSVVSNLFFAVCLVVLVGAIGLTFAAKNRGESITVAGYQPYLVATASMEPTFAVDGLVVTRTDDFAKVRVGDVVAFRAAGLNGKTALHRVIAIDNDRLFVKGDNNAHPDGASVTRENYIGRVTFHTNITAMFFQTLRRPGGLAFAVILPVAILILVYVGARWIIGDADNWRGKSFATCVVVMLVAGSLFASYTLSTMKQIHATNDGLGKVSDDFAKSSVDKNWTVHGKKILGRIEIPKISVNYPIIPYASAADLNISITHFSGAGLNQTGNDVLAGHRVFGQNSPFNLFFTNIDKLSAGDEIFITDTSRSRVKYRVTGYKTVAPDDISVLDQIDDGKKHLTLISCSFDLQNRYIVTAVAIE